MMADELAASYREQRKLMATVDALSSQVNGLQQNFAFACDILGLDLRSESECVWGLWGPWGEPCMSPLR